jgi:DNA (cytosine-5)-methyltransferase 1
LITEGDFVNELALFAGAGGGILGGKLLGWRTVCAVEWEQYPASVLCARQNDKILETFPIWDDVQTFDGTRWRGIVDVVSGGFPCQDISAAGKGAGIDGERSGMWGEMARIIHEVRPRYAFVENSPMLTSRGLGRVLGDLASMGFDARWGVLGAANVGANHQRDRIWIVAKWRGQLSHSQHNRIRRWEQQQESIKKENGNLANSNSIWGRRRYEYKQSKRDTSRESIGFSSEIINEQIPNSSSEDVERQRSISIGTQSKFRNIGNASWWQSEPNVGRVADGVVARVDRLKAIGNGQVPLCAATAWRILSE